MLRQSPGERVRSVRFSFQPQDEESSLEDEPSQSVDLGVKDGLFHRADESIVQCRAERERRPQRDHWGRDGMECLPPLYRRSHLR